eukprot:82687_1
MSTQATITRKLDNLIDSVASNMATKDDAKDQQTEEQKAKPIPTKPEQPSSEYDLSKPYRIIVKEGNQGGAEKLTIQNFDLDSIVLADNQLLIDIQSSGINFIDTYHRSGLYKNVFNLGKEGAGIVLKIGKKVDNYEPKDRVCWFSIQGSYATHIVTTNDNMGLMKIPPSLFNIYEDEQEAFDIAASIGIQALTAHYLCRSLYPVNNQTSVLIHAGAGGTGGILIQICKQVLQCPLVITTVGSEEKKKIALEYGADHVILYKKEDFTEKLMEITKNNGVNVVFDGVGKATHQGSLQCTTVRGMCVFFGNASGAVPPIDPLALTKAGSVFITRPTLSHYIRSPQELKFRYDEIFSWMEKKTLNIRIGNRFNLNDVFDAHTALETRQTIGKIILKKAMKKSEK